jgi:hypothetical protein
MLILMFSIEESFICLHWINARDIICSHDLIRVTVLVLIAALHLMVIIVIVEIYVVLSYLRKTSESLLLVIQVTNVPLLVLILIKNHNSLLLSLTQWWLCFLGSWPVRTNLLLHIVCVSTTLILFVWLAFFLFKRRVNKLILKRLLLEWLNLIVYIRRPILYSSATSLHLTRLSVRV